MNFYMNIPRNPDFPIPYWKWKMPWNFHFMYINYNHVELSRVELNHVSFNHTGYYYIVF